MTQQIFESKAEQRNLTLRLRRGMTDTELSKKSAQICSRLLLQPEIQRARLILSYMPTYDEVDVSSLNRGLCVSGKRVCYPVTAGGGMMSAYEPNNDSAFEKKRYGILEPVTAQSHLIPPEDIDVVLLPCVAFDDKLNRLGHGAGYYDRFLPLCTKAVKIAAAFEIQRLDEVLCGEHDVPLDMVVTEKKIYKI